MTIKFEPVQRVIYENIPYHLPERKTKGAAAYDLEAIEDIIIPPKVDIISRISNKISSMLFQNNIHLLIDSIFGQKGESTEEKVFTLEEVADLTKGNRPTIVRTGMKIKIPEDMVCIVVPRSSSSMKYWLKMSNSIGIIDSDYYNSPENDGEIGLIFENDFPFPIKIKKGDIIGQALIMPRYIVDNEKEIESTRTGGYGSTTK